MKEELKVGLRSFAELLIFLQKTQARPDDIRRMLDDHLFIQGAALIMEATGSTAQEVTEMFGKHDIMAFRVTNDIEEKMLEKEMRSFLGDNFAEVWGSIKAQRDKHKQK